MAKSAAYTNANLGTKEGFYMLVEGQLCGHVSFVLVQVPVASVTSDWFVKLYEAIPSL